jgi:hypothetical protein
MRKGERKSVGIWTWNSDVLWSKINQDEPGCYKWLGSTGPQTNLFGAQKNGVGQMTQARRILYMDVTGMDCQDIQITHRCGDPYCMNFEHFETKPNQRKYYLDGTLRGTKPKIDKQAGLQRRNLKLIDKEWYLR